MARFEVSLSTANPFVFKEGGGANVSKVAWCFRNSGPVIGPVGAGDSCLEKSTEVLVKTSFAPLKFSTVTGDDYAVQFVYFITYSR